MEEKNLKNLLNERYSVDMDGEVFGNAKSTSKRLDILSKLFENPEELNKNFLLSDIDSLISKVKTELTNSNYPEMTSSHSKIKLKSVGKDKASKNQNDMINPDKYDAAMRALVNYGDLRIHLIKKNDELTYLIETLASASNVREVLSSYLGQAETCGMDTDISGYNKHQKKGFAVCVKVPGQQQNKSMQSANWISGITSANINSDYIISVSAVKIDGKEIQSRIRQLRSIYSQLSKYTETTFNASVGDSVNNKINQNLIELVAAELKEKIIGGRTFEGSASLSASLSNVRKNNEAEKYLKLYAEAIENLIEIDLSAGWNVGISVSAESQITFDTLTSIISASFADSNYLINWNNKKPEATAQVSLKDIPLFFKLPNSDFPGFETRENEDLSQNTADVTGIELGLLTRNNYDTKLKFHIAPNQFNLHAFICGMTGSGKSNTTFSLLEKCELPFFVIEPVKGEYRKLTARYKEMNTYHMNVTESGLFRVNPFWFPQGKGNLAYHIDALKSIITSAFALYAAMPNILEQCILSAYTNRGWNIVSGENVHKGLVPDNMLYPTFGDLCTEVEDYLEKSAFTGETLGTYQGALLSRLKSFTTGSKGAILNNCECPDYERWFDGKCVVELDALANDADKSIVMGAIIVQYCQFVKQKGMVDELRHLIVIEEAHRLFKNIGQKNGNAEIAAPEAQLVELLSNMMAEIRAYGEGILIIDQSPSKVAEDVIKNSNIKIVHRLDHKKDIQIIEPALLLKDSEHIISSLKQGYALVRVGGMQKPAKVSINESKCKKNKSSNNSDSNSNEINVICVDNSFKSYANADYVITKPAFATEFLKLCEKLVNHLLYDELYDFNLVFDKFKEKCELLLKRYGFLNILQESDKAFFTRLLDYGIGTVIEKRFQNDYFLNLQCFLFSKKLYELVLDGYIKTPEIAAFTAFRETQIYTLLRNQAESGAIENAIGLTVILGKSEKSAVYVELLLKIALETDNKCLFKDDLWKNSFIMHPKNWNFIVKSINAFFGEVLNDKKARK